MDRYSSFGPADSRTLDEGDRFFTGVNQFDSPENLQPGECQDAVNCDMTTATAATRGGWVCVPVLGNAPFDAAATWTSRASAADSNWRSITYGAGRFVAVASGSSNQIMYSADAINWTAVTLGGVTFNRMWNGICFGNGLFVAVALSGTGDRVMTSPDGITWTQRTSAADFDWWAVTFGDDLFVAVAQTGVTQQVMTSPDGITWTLRTTPTPLSGADWNSIAYGNGIYAAVSGGGSASTNRAMTSSDGITWTERTTPNSVAYNGIAFGGDKFVAVAGSGAGGQSAMTSTDGITWTLRTTPDATPFWRAVAFGNGLFVAVGDAGAERVMTSPDGITWTARTAAAANSWLAVANGNNTFVAVSNDGVGNRVMTSGATSAVFGTGSYSDPDSPAESWVVLVGRTSAAFYAFGRESRTVDYPSGYTVSQLSTVTQANNLLFIFAGEGQTPIQWDGVWGHDFEEVPASSGGGGFESIPESNQATYYQNRLWVVNGKDMVAASDVLDFEEYDVLANEFNLNTGSSDYVIKTHPFGDNGLVVFKNRSSILLQNVQAGLDDVTATEITRELGIIGINACVTVGPDLVYMSDRNITSIRLNLQNQLQAVTEPLSKKIRRTMRRINWAYGYKISMGYWNNHLYVAVPLDESTVCDTVLVYNFITQQWYGRWTFDATMGMPVIGFVVANYFGENRLHAATEDGRVFVTNEGQNDISGTRVPEIELSLTTRPYRMDNNNRVNRRLWIDTSTNRPDYSITAFVEGASESEEVVANQTYSRADSWIFNDEVYEMDNSNDDFNRAFRKDYSTGPDSVESGSGFEPEMRQTFRLPVITRRKGRLTWMRVDNTQGFMEVNGVGFEARAGDRTSLIQVG